MSLYLVLNGWMANGACGVIVEADSAPEAMDSAAQAFIAQADADLWPNPPAWMVEHHAEQIAGYQTREGWTVERIDLPYLGEFG